MTELNIETMVVIDSLLQVRDLSAGMTDALCVGKQLLHAICIFRGETIKLYDLKDPIVVRSILRQIEPDSECVICLEPMFGMETVLPFDCGHPMCRDCYDTAVSECPSCREKTPWSSLSLMHISEECKSEVHRRGSVKVGMRVR